MSPTFAAIQIALVDEELGRIAAVDRWQDELFVASEEIGLLGLGSEGHAAPAGAWELPASITDITQNGHYFFLAAAYQGLLITERPALNPVASLGLPGKTNAVAYRGDTVYALTEHDGLFVIDVSITHEPRILRQLDVVGEGHELLLTGRYLLIAAGSGGLHLYQIDFPEAPDHVMTYEGSQDIYDATYYDGYVYVANWSGVQLLELRDPGTLHLHYSVATNGFARGLVVAEDRLFIADGDGVQLVDVSNLNMIQTQTFLPLPGQVQAVAFQQGQLFVSLGEAGLVVLDATELKLEAAYDTAGQVHQILPMADELLVADGAGGLLRLAQMDYHFQTFLPIAGSH